MYAGLAPHDALALYAVIAYMDSVAGVYFPRGGMHAVPAAMAAAAEKHGVEIRYGTTVTAVERTRRPRQRRPHRRRAIGSPCDVVVLNPDLPVAYRDLLGIEPWSVRRLRYSPVLPPAAGRLDARRTPAPRTTTSTSAGPGARCSAS